MTHIPVSPDPSSGLSAAYKLPGLYVELCGGPWDGDRYWFRGARVLHAVGGRYELVQVRQGTGALAWEGHWV